MAAKKKATQETEVTMIPVNGNGPPAADSDDDGVATAQTIMRKPPRRMNVELSLMARIDRQLADVPARGRRRVIAWLLSKWEDEEAEANAEAAAAAMGGPPSDDEQTEAAGPAVV